MIRQLMKKVNSKESGLSPKRSFMRGRGGRGVFRIVNDNYQWSIVNRIKKGDRPVN
jgi:hypothetical protein